MILFTFTYIFGLHLKKKHTNSRTTQLMQIERLTYVRHIVNGSLQRQHRHIKAIRLWCELKVRMNVDLPDPERVSR